MSQIKRMLDEYAESHQNKTNQLVHKFCVPAILFSVIGLVLAIPNPSFLGEITFASILLVLSFFYYVKLSLKYALLMIPVLIIMYFGNLYLKNENVLIEASIVIFIISWIIQLWGHRIEGKKPSFLKDVFFLLIGPLWVLKALLKIND